MTEPTRSTSMSSPEYQAGSARNHKGLEFKGPAGDTGLQEWPGVEVDGGGSILGPRPFLFLKLRGSSVTLF